MSKRIETIINLIDPQTEEIWDLCCDHGKIGLAAYKKHPHLFVHFVDQVPSIAKKLNSLIPSYIPSKNFKITCDNIKNLSYKPKTCLIIAGVGGLLIEDVLKNIPLNNRPNQVIICPHQDIHTVRLSLNKEYGLKEEILCCEKGKYYEILSLSNSKEIGSISPIGEQMWDLTNENHSIYAEKNYKYYQLKNKHKPNKDHKLLLNFFYNLINRFNSPM